MHSRLAMLQCSGTIIDSDQHRPPPDLRDRLRAADVPLEAIDQLGSSSVSSIGSKHRKWYSVEHLREFTGWLKCLEGDAKTLL